MVEANIWMRQKSEIYAEQRCNYGNSESLAFTGCLIDLMPLVEAWQVHCYISLRFVFVFFKVERRDLATAIVPENESLMTVDSQARHIARFSVMLFAV